MPHRGRSQRLGSNKPAGVPPQALIPNRKQLGLVRPGFCISWRRILALGLLHRDKLKRRAMVSAMIVAEPVRCVECGTCTYNCPLGVDVRGRVRQGLQISSSGCLTCGECVARCPRGVLRFEVSPVFLTTTRGN